MSSMQFKSALKLQLERVKKSIVYPEYQLNVVGKLQMKYYFGIANGRVLTKELSTQGIQMKYVLEYPMTIFLILRSEELYPLETSL